MNPHWISQNQDEFSTFLHNWIKNSQESCNKHENPRETEESGRILKNPEESWNNPHNWIKNVQESHNNLIIIPQELGKIHGKLKNPDKFERILKNLEESWNILHNWIKNVQESRNNLAIITKHRQKIDGKWKIRDTLERIPKESRKNPDRGRIEAGKVQCLRDQLARIRRRLLSPGPGQWERRGRAEPQLRPRPLGAWPVALMLNSGATAPTVRFNVGQSLCRWRCVGTQCATCSSVQRSSPPRVRPRALFVVDLWLSG